MKKHRGNKMQAGKRWLAVSLCLLELLRPALWAGTFGEELPADSLPPIVSAPEPAADTPPPQEELPEEPQKEEPAQEEPPAETTEEPKAEASEEPTKAPQKEQPEKPERTKSAKPSPKEPTPAPKATTAPTKRPVTPDPNTPLPEPEETDEPSNAHEFADFSQGYAVLLCGTWARTAPHERKKSYEILPLSAGELVWVNGRTAYKAARDEEVDEDTPDWFSIQARDGEGNIVTGYVCGTDLWPLSAAETAELQQGWAEEQKLPEHSPAAEDGLPCVAGIYVPPEEEAEAEASENPAPPTAPVAESATPAPTAGDVDGEPPATAEPAETAEPEGIEEQEEAAETATPTLIPAATPENELAPELTDSALPEETPENTPVVEPTPDLEPSAVPEATETPAVASEPEEAEEAEEPTDNAEAEPTPTPPPDAFAERMGKAEALLAEGDEFFAQVNQRAQLMSRQAKLSADQTAPEILSVEAVKIQYDAPVDNTLPTQIMLTVYVQDSTLNQATEQVSGIREVAVYGPDPQTTKYSCSYDAKLDAYTVVVYKNGLYTVIAEDMAGQEARRTANVTGIDPASASDTQPPTIGTPQYPTQWQDSTPITVEVTDDQSGVGEVWLIGPDRQDIRYPAQADAEQPSFYTAEVFVNGKYLLYAKDCAGNVTKDPLAVVIRNIRDEDTYSPTLSEVSLDPPKRDDGTVEPMVSATIRAEDLPRPDAKPPERASGLAKVQVATYSYDEITETYTYSLLEEPDAYPLENSEFGYYFLQDGDYAFLVTDIAGNPPSATHFTIDYVGEPRVRIPNPDWALRPTDDDDDGLFTQTEYRLGLNPANRDTNSDGLWDGLSVRLGFSGSGENHAPAASILTKAGNDDMLAQLVANGRLNEPITERNPGSYRHDMQKLWGRLRNTVVWMTPGGDRLLCINNHGLFTAHINRSESVEIDGALSLYEMKLGYGGEVARSVEACEDGSLALLYDRDGYDGALKNDATLIDTARMKAYRIPNTRGALGVALSQDGNYLAIWYANRLVRLTLATGEVFQCDDAERCGNIELLAFLADGTLVTRATALGYSALTPDGKRMVGPAADLPALVQRRDLTAMTVLDTEQVPLEISLQLTLRSSGLFVKGEDPKQKVLRNLSAEDMYARSVNETLSASSGSSAI